MTQIVDLNPYKEKRSLRYYGGASCGKLGIVYHKENYLIKFPGSLKSTEIKNIDTSYSNSSTSEYLGSHIYEMLGIDVHETFLGRWDDKIVVACKDFLSETDRLWDFASLKTSMPIFDSEGDILTGQSTSLDETLAVIETHPDLEPLREDLRKRFWDMFIVDALIGNPDRNNGNWGVISNGSEFRLSPVFDNGSSFHFRKSDRQLRAVIDDDDQMRIQAYKGRVCIFERDGKKINPYKFILETEHTDCLAALQRIVPMMEKEGIHNLIDNTPALSDERKKFCKKCIDLRIDEVLMPALKKA